MELVNSQLNVTFVLVGACEQVGVTNSSIPVLGHVQIHFGNVGGMFVQRVVALGNHFGRHVLAAPGDLVYFAVTAAVVLLVNTGAFQSCNFEIDSAELYYVAHAKPVSLVLRAEVLQHLVERCLFADNQPHGALQIDVVLLILFFV